MYVQLLQITACDLYRHRGDAVQAAADGMGGVSPAARVSVRAVSRFQAVAALMTGLPQQLGLSI
jgi:hypothetical protein